MAGITPSFVTAPHPAWRQRRLQPQQGLERGLRVGRIHAHCDAVALPPAVERQHQPRRRRIAAVPRVRANAEGSVPAPHQPRPSLYDGEAGLPDQRADGEDPESLAAEPFEGLQRCRPIVVLRRIRPAHRPALVDALWQPVDEIAGQAQGRGHARSDFGGCARLRSLRRDGVHYRRFPDRLHDREAVRVQHQPLALVLYPL